MQNFGTGWKRCPTGAADRRSRFLTASFRPSRNDAVEFRVERATGPFCRATRPTAARKPRMNTAQRCRNRTDRDRSPVAAGGGGESRGGIRKILFVATRCKPGRLAVRNSSCPTAVRTTRALNGERPSCVRLGGRLPPRTGGSPVPPQNNGIVPAWPGRCRKSLTRRPPGSPRHEDF